MAVENIDGSKLPSAVAPSKQVRSRLDDPDKALHIISEARNLMQGRLDTYKEVAERYDRQPPWSEKDLQADGLGWLTNIDWGHMEEEIDKITEIYENLMTGGEVYAKFFTKYSENNNIDEMSILAEKYKELLDNWGEFGNNNEQMCHWRGAMGLGIFYWSRPDSWQYEALHPGNLILPRGKKLSPDTWSWFAIDSEFDIVDLLEKLENETKAKALGWNISGIRKVISALEHGANLVGSIARDAVSYVEGIKNDDLYYASINQNAIKGWVFYVKEWTGKISERILVEASGEKLHNQAVFLYNGVGRHKKMSDLFALFPHSLGQGYVDRVRGYGVKMLPYHDVQNNMLNHTIDVTTIASNIMVKGGDTSFRKLQEEIDILPITLLPDDIDIQQEGIANTSRDLLSLRSTLLGEKASKNRAFGGATDVARDVEKTAKEATMRYQESKTLESFAYKRFYRQLDNFHTILWKKIKKVYENNKGKKNAKHSDEVKTILDFFKELEEEGCTKECWDKVYKVEATRIFGDGDPVQQFLAMMDLMPFYGALSPSEQVKFIILVFTARAGKEIRDEILGGRLKGIQDGFESNQKHVAQLENVAFETSDIRVDVDTENHNHAIHAGEHIVFCEEMKQLHDQGQISSEKMFQILGRLGATGQTEQNDNTLPGHMILHLNILAQDKNAKFLWEDYNARWQQANGLFAQLQNNLSKKRQAEQQQQIEQMQNPPELTIKQKELAAREENVKLKEMLVEMKAGQVQQQLQNQ